VGGRHRRRVGVAGGVWLSRPTSPNGHTIADGSPRSSGADGDLRFVVKAETCGVSAIGSEPMTEEAKGEFCLFELTVSNPGSHPQTFAATNQYLFDPIGTRYTVDLRTVPYVFSTGDGPPWRRDRRDARVRRAHRDAARPPRTSRIHRQRGCGRSSSAVLSVNWLAGIAASLAGRATTRPRRASTCRACPSSTRRRCR
jgi:hypothetical protein